MRYLLDMATHRVFGMGIAFGSCMAIVISYTSWRSIPWAILHGAMGWGYVIFHALRHGGGQ